MTTKNQIIEIVKVSMILLLAFHCKKSGMTAEQVRTTIVKAIEELDGIMEELE